MNPVIYAVVDPTATDPKARMMPVSGADNGDGTCSLATTGGGGGGGTADSTAANQLLQLTQETATATQTTALVANLGDPIDTVAAADISAVSLIALFKRHLQRWTTFFTLLPASLGSKADAASLAVTASTEDKAVQAAIAASLVAIDTGTPAALGQTTAAASMPVVLANNAALPNSAIAAATTVLNAVTSVSEGLRSTIQKGVRTWVLRGTTSAGAGTATVLVQGSVDGTDWVTIGTMTLTLGTTATMDSFTEQSSFVQFRGNVTVLTGTSASVTLKVGA